MKFLMFRFCLVLLLLHVAYSLFSQGDSLVAVFHFEGDAVDSVMNREGRVDGPILVADRFGNEEGAYEFDGTDDIIVVLDDSLLRLEEDFTLAVWFMPYSEKDGVLFRKNSSQNQFPSLGYGVGVSGTGHHAFTISTDSSANGLSSQGPLINEYMLDKWNLIIASKRQDTIYMVTNEVGRGRYTFYEKQIQGTIRYDGGPLVIGTRSQLPANTFHGRIDEIRIYNQFLTVEELTGVNFEDETTSVTELINSPFNIYPSPFDSEIFISNKEASSEEIILELFDLSGQRVLTTRVLSNTRINTAALDQGIYFVLIKTNEEDIIGKLIKTK